MKLVRLYDTPEKFAEMMARQLRKSMQVSVRQREGEPLMLEIGFNSNNSKEKMHVSFHSAYLQYRATGDWDAVLRYLNDVVRNSRYMRAKDDVPRLDPAYIYPAIREERYVKEAGREAAFVSDKYLPGLRQIYLEIKDGCTKIVTKSILASNLYLTEAEVKSLAFRNLQKGGWHPPSLSLNSRLRSSCTFDVYLEPPFPIECQFLLPGLAMRRIPSDFVIAFTNRQCTLVMRSNESMDTSQRALELVRESGFKAIVQRSLSFMPSPVSDRLFWVRDGKASPL